MDPMRLAILYNPDGDGGGNAQWDCPMCSMRMAASDLHTLGADVAAHIQHHIDFDELPY